VPVPEPVLGLYDVIVPVPEGAVKLIVTEVRVALTNIRFFGALGRVRMVSVDDG
jgi:hypothetical protein